MARPEKVRHCINSCIKIRWLLVCSWLFMLVGLVFALLVYCSGNIHNNRKNLVIVRFNISSLGLNHYHDTSTNLSIPLKTPYKEQFIDERDNNTERIEMPLNITRVLGMPDWYTLSYHWVCKGLFVPPNERNASNASYITQDHPDMDENWNRTKNVTCRSRGMHEKYFSLQYEVAEDLGEKWESLAGIIKEDIKPTKYHVRLWQLGWLGGLMFAVPAFCIMPWTFARKKYLGKKHRCVIPISLSLVASAFFLGVACDQGSAIHLKPKHMRLFTDPNNPAIAEASKKFFSDTILSMVFLFTAFCVGVIGWGVGLWLEDSMSMNGRRNSGVSDMRRLSHPEGEHMANETV